jgi:NADPH2:quinone reductase
MKAIRVSQTGGPEVLELTDVDVPEPGPGEIRVKLAAIGVNFIDVYIRTGLYKGSYPYTPGQEGAGTVDAIGEGVTTVRVGERVAWGSGPQGAYAEYAVVPAEKVVAVPDAIDDRTACAAMLQGITAHYLTHGTYPIQQGDTILVNAAAGGVGLLLVQLAKARGATVIGVASSEAKQQLVREAGADYAIGYDAVLDTVKSATNGVGVDCVYDSVGKDTFLTSIDALRIRGYFVLFGTASGPIAPIDPQFLSQKGSLFFTRPTAIHFTRTHAEIAARTHDLFSLIESKALDVRIGHTYALADARRAHEELGARGTTGKLLLIP